MDAEAVGGVGKETGIKGAWLSPMARQRGREEHRLKAEPHRGTDNRPFIELGGLDFLLAGAESMGATRCRTKGAVLSAARALALYLNPDNAEMFKS